MLNHLSTRRDFLRSGLTLVAAGATVPAFLSRTGTVMADPLDAPLTQRPGGKDGRILVVLQLSGGNDGLSTVVPWSDDFYHRARPGIGLDAAKVLKLDDRVGLHPGLAPLMKLYERGRMAVVQGVGYPNPDRSHFRSMDIWHSARPDVEQPTSGWLGRYFDSNCPGRDPRAGVSVGQALPLAMRGERVTPLAFERPDGFRYNGPDVPAWRVLNRGADAAGPHAAPPVTPAGQLDFLRRTALDAQLSSDEILRVARGHRGVGDYPLTEFGQGMRTVAAMIGGGLSTRVYYVSLGGFDTHAQQKSRHDQLIAQLARGVAAFFADLAEQKNDDRVLLMTFSEFGRRVAQNASLGTDHGTAAPVLLLGPALEPGLVGSHPSLDPKDLDRGDLRFAIDFRGVYATVLEKWLQTPARPILGEVFEPLPLMKAT